MKKISIVALGAALVIPAFAEENIDDVAQDTSITEQYEQQFKAPEIKEPTNPKIKFPHGMQVGLGISPTTGLNGFIGYNNKKFDSFWAKRFGIRFDFASFSPIKNKLNTGINDSIGDEGYEIEENLKIDNFAMNAKHYGALVDFYPFGDTWFLGGWRLSGGYMTGKLDLDANIHGKPVGGAIEFELDGKKYTYDGNEMRGTASVDWKFKGPYVGTGFDFGLLWGIKIYFDAGVVFSDQAAKLNLDVPLDGLKNEFGNVVAENATLEEQYETAKANTLKKAQDELDKFPYYPIVKLGLMYRF